VNYECKQTDREEVHDVGCSSLSKQYIDANCEIDKTDESDVEATSKVSLSFLKTIEIGDAFCDASVTRIVHAKNQVTQSSLIAAEVLGLIEIDLDVVSFCDLLEWIQSGIAYANQTVAGPDARACCRTTFFDAIGNDAPVGTVSPNDAVGEDRTLDYAVPQIERSRNNGKHCYKKQQQGPGRYP